MLSTARPVDWAVFAGSVVGAMLLDRFVLGKPGRRIAFREAAVRSLLWVALGLAFSLYVRGALGPAEAIDYLVAYLVEKSLSVDNLFVFLVIFDHFKVDDRQQQRVLSWGIIGALLMRALFIMSGTALLQRFHWAMYLFGAFLLYSGIQLMVRTEPAAAPAQTLSVRLARRYLRTIDRLQGDQFLVREQGCYWATPLLILLVVIESTDLVFAVDSVPAVLAISRDLFVVYTSNLWAVLGLRALYFLLVGMMRKFHYLEQALSGILSFVGIKMLAVDYLEINNLVSLGVIGALFLAAVLASLSRNRSRKYGKEA